MRAFIPAVTSNAAPARSGTIAESLGHYSNMVTVPLDGGGLGVTLRSEFLDTSKYTPSASTNRGRGVISFGGNFDDLYLDEDTFYFDGGSQDLTATTGNGYAGNTGFNEEYLASFVEHRVSGDRNLVIVNAGHTSTNASANHGNIWYTPDASTAPSSVSNANLPCNNGVSICRGGASLDGYFFIGDITGKIYNSNLNDLTTWTGTDFLTAEREADIGVYTGKHHDHVVQINTKSIEFFYNAGNASGSPLARRSDAYHAVGCYYPNSIVEVGDTIYFVGTDHAGASRIYVLQGFQLTPISTPLIESQLLDIQGTFPDITLLDPLRDKMIMSWGFLGGMGGLFITYNSSWTYWWNSVTGIFHRIGVAAGETYLGGITSSWSQTLGIMPIVSHNKVGDDAGSSVSRFQLINGRIVTEGSLGNDGMDDWGNTNDPQAWVMFPQWDAGTDARKAINWVKVIHQGTGYSLSSRDPFNAVLKWRKMETGNASGNNPPLNGLTGSFSGSRTLNINLRGGNRATRLGSARGVHFLLDLTGSGHGPISTIVGLEVDYDILE